MSSSFDLGLARTLLEEEGRRLDEQSWQEWLEMYAPDCEYWVPTRRDDEQLTSDPETELSHIYYASRAGLEDRILRITSGQSAASTPTPRTAHVLSGLTWSGEQRSERVSVRNTWMTSVYLVRSRTTHIFFGSANTEFEMRGGDWLIRRKKIVLHNDYIPTLMDIYCF